MSNRWPQWFPNGEGAPLAALVVAIVVFAAIAPGFFTVPNFFELTRSSVETGLIAIAITAVLITGGIDLSVGSIMGLTAVVFGIAQIDWQLPVPSAVGLALLVGIAGGWLNGLLIARLSIPPLIVTLGTLSLFRGIAEGLTQAAVSYSGFPPRFVSLGQGYLPGGVPAQLPILLAAIVGYAVLLHRSVIGRTWYAIGFNAASSRYAGVPVARRIALVYVLSGVMASLAGIVYVAHVGQARASAGTGYELDALTAVVLGGTSVFGGRGTIGGTLIGVFLLVVLKNGLALAALPAELIGIVTGLLLVGTIALDRMRRTGSTTDRSIEGDALVKNSQVAVICASIVGAALLIAATNFWLVQSVTRSAGQPSLGPQVSAVRRPIVAMMPKAKGDPYFVSCRVGAEQAAAELGVDLIWDGPTSLDAARQNELVESWITRGVDVIAVAVENRGGISSVLRKARSRGIKVLTWDADAEVDARDYFVNQATAEGIGTTLTDEAARLLAERGEFAVVTGALTAANQNEWISFIRKRLAERYPNLKLALIRPSDDDRDKAFAETQTIMRVAPNVKLVMAISAPAVPGAAEAVRQAGRRGDVHVIGLSLPNINKQYVHDGTVQTVVLWNTADLGYLTVHAAAQLVRGGLTTDTTTMQAGRLGTIEVRQNQIILGQPLRFTQQNIDRYNF